MNKFITKAAGFILPAVLTVTFAATTLTVTPSAFAASAKEQIQLPGNASYYGEILNSKPNGEGTLTWSDKKQYTGHFVNGERSGNGKYSNEYVDSQGNKHNVSFNGIWSQDMMVKGTYTEKMTESSGRVTMNEVIVGTFKNGQLQNGYRAMRALSYPDYAFTYKGNGETLYVIGSNVDMVKSWENGKMFYVVYQKGSIFKQYWDVKGETLAKERARQLSIKYLKKITAQVSPQLQQFEKLSKLILLK